MSMVPTNNKAAAPRGCVANVTNLLAVNMQAIKSCLPKHLTPERMCRIAVQTISHTPQLQRCSPASLVGAIVEASSLGLEIDTRGLAYLVPYKTDVTLILGYKGLMDLAYRSGRVAQIYAETVCEHDEFTFELGLEPKLTHRPNLEERGRLRAVYAVAKLKDADPVFVVMGRGEIDKIRKASRASNNGPWVQWEEEMWKKTAIRRLCKYLPLSPEMQRAVALDEASETHMPQHLGESILNLEEDAYGPTKTEALNTALETHAEPVTEAQAAPVEEPAKPAAKTFNDGDDEDEDDFYRAAARDNARDLAEAQAGH